ncbi:MAG: hypothetical protein GY828_08390 [Candidatus Gracilibacteria bacterium]|nr:hypothetical protein [Candidatus Gracilibacteria bacterium]
MGARQKDSDIVISYEQAADDLEKFFNVINDFIKLLDVTDVIQYELNDETFDIKIQSLDSKLVTTKGYFTRLSDEIKHKNGNIKQKKKLYVKMFLTSEDSDKDGIFLVILRCIYNSDGFKEVMTESHENYLKSDDPNVVGIREGISQKDIDDKKSHGETQYNESINTSVDTDSDIPPLLKTSGKIPPTLVKEVKPTSSEKQDKVVSKKNEESQQEEVVEPFTANRDDNPEKPTTSSGEQSTDDVVEKPKQIVNFLLFAVVFLLLGTVGYFTYENNVNIAEQVAKGEVSQQALTNKLTEISDKADEKLAEVGSKTTEMLNGASEKLGTNIDIFKDEVNPKLEELDVYVVAAKEKVESMNATFNETTAQITEKGDKVIEEFQQNGNDAIAKIETKNKSLIVKTVNDVIKEKNLVTEKKYKELEKQAEQEFNAKIEKIKLETAAKMEKLSLVISELEKDNSKFHKLSKDMKELVCGSWFTFPKSNDSCKK